MLTKQLDTNGTLREISTAIGNRRLPAKTYVSSFIRHKKDGVNFVQSPQQHHTEHDKSRKVSTQKERGNND